MVFGESVTNCYQILVCDKKHAFSEFRVICVYRTPDCCASGSHQLCKAISDYSASNLVTVSVSGTHGFQQLVSAPTIRNSVLDLILCNEQGFFKGVRVRPPTGIPFAAWQVRRFGDAVCANV